MRNAAMRALLALTVALAAYVTTAATPAAPDAAATATPIAYVVVISDEKPNGHSQQTPVGRSSGGWVPSGFP